MKNDVDEDESGTSSGTSSSGISAPETTVVCGNPRASRNMAEKQRRDNLNTNIARMAALVPIVAVNSRKMDKISILRLAAAFLRTQYTLGSGSTNFLPRQFVDFDLEQYFVDHIVGSNGFFLVITTTGKIVYVSRHVEQHLGHVQNEMLGQSLYSFVYLEDHDELKRNLSTEDIQSTTAKGNISQISELVHDNNSSSSEDSTTNHKPNERLKFFREQRRNFSIRLAQRTVSKRNTTQYECFEISGVLRLADACKNADLNGNKGKYRETSTTNDIVFAGIATLPKKRLITDLSILDMYKDEYVTRHLVDGRIIYCDHRISLIAGYMSEEVSGENAFKYMHKDDFRWTMIGLRQMYDRAETYGSSCYRLFTKNGGFIYLRTHGYLEFDKDTQTVESFVCVNTLVSEEEGIELMKEMKTRFSAIVSSASKNLILDSTLSTDLDSNISSRPESNLETTQKIEDAINQLISDLPSPAVSEDHFSPAPAPDSQFVKAVMFSKGMPPAATQAKEIGINKIDRYILNGKRNRKLSQDSNDHTMNKSFNPSSAEQSPISDAESPKVCGKNLAMLDIKNTHVHNNIPSNIHNNIQSANMSLQSNVLVTNNTNPCVSCNPTSRRNVPKAVNVLKQERIEQHATCNVNMSPSSVQESIRMEQKPETFNNRMIKQEPSVQYFDDNTNDSSVISSGLTSPSIETHNRGPLKRICDDDISATHNKRRSNDVYASTNGIGTAEQQNASYLKCKIYATENKYPAFSAGLNQYNDISPQPLLIESPNSSLHEVTADSYQHLADPLGTMHSDDEQFDDMLLGPELKNPELMMKLFDNLHPEPVPNLNYENFNEAKVQQFLSANQAVNDEIRRTCDELADSMAFRESQINGLKHELEYKLLSAQRENLSQLQVEHNMQKQMLRNLQHDHRKMQLNTKHTHGV
ncbi:circadian locomoter output cycles protein kaput-like isoform X2 [Pseudomyrmex gracilis]|uniref:circadian locomoter output cycles protein kaput-like isoform X2 n=1 Tax=Pseudomyrmex gracilis TaxID=219809 RepID=UPI00099556E6|nr:circadian locomoter output cycles protein kaput-like isoform X2 [Pseudomyrmex gracilis]